MNRISRAMVHSIGRTTGRLSKQIFEIWLFMLVAFNRRWCRRNPHWQIPTRSIQKKLTVWIAVLDNQLIGPYFFDGTVNGENYLRMLRTYLLPEMKRRRINIQSTIFVHDGAPPHGTTSVTNFLNENFDFWIGQRSEIKWPPRSPDLSVLDYFLWGYLKNEVYKKTSENPSELRERIIDACDNLTPQMLRNATQGFRRRLELCIERDGDLFEEHL